MRPLVIAFAGNMGSGKSTAIAKFKRSTGHTELVKFADPLYDIQNFVYTRIGSVYSKPENFVKDRKLLQWLGTEWGRESISETIWVDVWRQKVRSLIQQHAYTENFTVVCDDVRFDNEVEAVHSVGGCVVQINSTRTKERIDTTSGICNHKSESGLNQKLVDYVIENNGSIAEFELAVRNLYGLIVTKERNGT